MIAQPKLASADARLATIARLNDRCRQGLDRTARIMVTRTCLGTLACDDGAMEIVVQARLFAAVRRHVFTGSEAAERDRGDFEFEGTTVYFKIDLYEETVVKNTFCVSFPVRLPAPLPSYSNFIDWH